MSEHLKYVRTVETPNTDLSPVWIFGQCVNNCNATNIRKAYPMCAVSVSVEDRFIR